MAALSIHQRHLPASAAQVGALIDSLASDTDALWPTPQWPPMQFDRPLGVGAIGGHSIVRYTVEHYVPGQWIRFRFTGPRGFDGFHEFTVEPRETGTDLVHLLQIRPRGIAHLSWPFAFRWMHDALLEESLDRAERSIIGKVAAPYRWPIQTRLLFWLASRLD